MTSFFSIQIVDNRSGEVVLKFAPGMAVEKQLVEELVGRVIRKGVGFWRTEAHVRQDIVDAVNELLFDLKAQVPPA